MSDSSGPGEAWGTVNAGELVAVAATDGDATGGVAATNGEIVGSAASDDAPLVLTVRVTSLGKCSWRSLASSSCVSIKTGSF